MNLKGKRRKLFLLLAVVVLAGGFWLWKVLNAPVPQYQTLIVRPGELQQNVLATGKLDALRKVDVGAQVSGQLKTLSVEIGKRDYASICATGVSSATTDAAQKMCWS